MKKRLLKIFLLLATAALIPSIKIQAASTLSLVSSYIQVEEGEYGEIEVKSNSTSKKPTYKTSNASVAEVYDDGSVYGENAGHATITVKAGKETITCEVVVLDPSLTLQTYDCELMKGETAEIPIKENSTGEKATYKSSNKKVAKVTQKGVVTAVGTGNAYIEVSAGGHSCRYQITVLEEGLLLNSDEITLNKGDKSQITIRNTTGLAPTYKSNKKKVVSVSKTGLLTAKKAGTATITIKAGKETAKLKVTVQKKIYPTGIAFWDDNGEEGFWNHDYRNQGNYMRYLDIYPKNATETELTFRISDTSLATVSKDGIVTPTKKALGSFTLTATTVNGLSDSIEITLTAPLGRIEPEKVDTKKPDLDTTIICNGKEMGKLGWSTEKLLATAGEPIRKEINEYSGTTYVYRPRRDQLLHIYVDDNTVKGYLIMGKDITAAGFTLGKESTLPDYIGYDGYEGDMRYHKYYEADSYTAMVYYDRYNNENIYALEVQSIDFDYYNEARYTRANGDSEYEQMVYNEALDMINTYRAMYGHGDLKRNSIMDLVSKNHARYVVKEKHFSHITKEGEGPYDRLAKAGGAYSIFVSENLGGISYTVLEDIHGLICSDGHRDNFLNDTLKHIGIGYEHNAEDPDYVTTVYLFQR